MGDITIIGLSITSSWGNGHATIFRALAAALARRGHRVRFLERDQPWYARHRDLTALPGVDIHLYDSVGQLQARFARQVRDADLVMVGSYVPDGVAVGRWVTEQARGVTCFYDIDTPVTLAKLEAGDHEYLTPDLIARYGMYLSFTGGPVLDVIESRYGSPAARAFYCCVDPDRYRPEATNPSWDLGYMGTYSDDRQPGLDALLLEPARRLGDRRFVVAGPQYPADIRWPDNVERIEHLPPARHARFYNRQRFTLNLTRAQMVRTGYAPSVRLFEAAACGCAIISDWWEGLDTFFTPGEEILVVEDACEVEHCLTALSESQRRAIGAAARRRTLAHHTADHRAAQLESYLHALIPA